MTVSSVTMNTETKLMAIILRETRRKLKVKKVFVLFFFSRIKQKFVNDQKSSMICLQGSGQIMMERECKK